MEVPDTESIVPGKPLRTDGEPVEIRILSGNAR